MSLRECEGGSPPRAKVVFINPTFTYMSDDARYISRLSQKDLRMIESVRRAYHGALVRRGLKCAAGAKRKRRKA
jgi:hypothetical protein